MAQQVFTAVALAASIAVGVPAWSQEGYRLRAGDTLRVEVIEDSALNRSVLVAPDGRITVPLAGGVQAAGRTVEAVQADLIARLGPSFNNPPSVYVALERQSEARRGGVGAAGFDIFVLGEAAKPGKIAVTPGTTVLQAFAQMGGFTKFAAVKRIQLRRGAQSWTLNYADIEAGRSEVGSMTVAAGDVIVIPQRRLFE